MSNPTIEQYRSFLKNSIRKAIDFSKTDQNRGVPPPPIEKPFSPDAELIDLPSVSEFKGIVKFDLLSAIEERQSWRNFGDESLSIDQLSFLLWATQGVRKQVDSGHALRTVPSAGARHALETYLCIMKVEGLAPGLYRYLPLEHQLMIEQKDTLAGRMVAEASFDQTWMASGAVVFMWAAIPYRMEWRYDLAAHKVILLDAGHVCQNLYLACEAIGVGTCAVGAYDQEEIDKIIELDGTDEFVIYMAAVGQKMEHPEENHG
jgi:SagB-type dehydrogenase family enzyme